jgi:hypothetical protein
MAALAQPVPLESTIAEAVAAVSTPKGVRLKRIFFDHDHAGEPAIRVVFAVSVKIALTKPRVNELASFRRAVRDAISALGYEPFPYVTFEDAR